MILLISNRADVTTDFVVAALRACGATFVRLNTEDVLREWRLSWTTSGWSAIDTRGRRIVAEELHAVYYRRPLPVRPLDGTAADAAGFVARETAALLRGLFAGADDTWISAPRTVMAAEDKLGQLRLAERLGLAVPRTLVTNDPAEARAFVAAVGRAIVKPLSSGRLSDDPPRLGYTTPIDAPRGLDAVALCPHLLQVRIPKRADVRVTVVDRSFVACRIDSQAHPATALDWRMAHGEHIELPHELITLPDELAQRCIELVRELGLRFGAIDFVEDERGGYTFLEINPNGQWAWIEERTGAPIARMLADALLAGAPRHHASAPA